MSPEKSAKDLKGFAYWVAPPLLEEEDLLTSRLPIYCSEAVKAGLLHPNAAAQKGKRFWGVLDLYDPDSPEYVIDRRAGKICLKAKGTSLGGLVCISDQVLPPKKGDEEPGFLRLTRKFAELDHGSAVTLFIVGEPDQSIVKDWTRWLITNKLCKVDARKYHLTFSSDRQPVLMISARRPIVTDPKPSDILKTEFHWPLEEIKVTLGKMNEGGYRISMSDWVEMGNLSRRHLMTNEKLSRGACLKVSAKDCGCFWIYDKNGAVVHSPCNGDDCQGDPGIEGIIEKAAKRGWRSPFRKSRAERLAQKEEVGGKKEKVMVPDLVATYPEKGSTISEELRHFANDIAITGNWTENGFNFVRSIRLVGRDGCGLKIINSRDPNYHMPIEFWQRLKPGDIVRSGMCGCRYVALDVGFRNINHNAPAAYLVEKYLVRFIECPICAEERVVVK